MDSPESMVMAEIAKRSLARRTELCEALNAPREAMESVLKNLVAKGLVMKVSPVGETAYALTQKGNKSLSEMA